MWAPTMESSVSLKMAASTGGARRASAACRTCPWWKTSDRGRSWASIVGDLPVRGSVHTIAEDHDNPKLLFVGTEFGLFFTQDGGRHWHQLKQGFPTIAVRDLEIQRRESDLVVGTFGRGIYILDDYAALRSPAGDLDDLALFPVRDPWLYVPRSLWDSGRRGSMGAQFFTAENPPHGAVFTYYLADGIESRAEARRAEEIKIEKEGGDTPYPSWSALRAEDNELEPALFLLVKDDTGQLVRRVPAETDKGLHRSAWDLRLPSPDPVKLGDDDDRPWFSDPPVGPLALPGNYTARLAVYRDGELRETGGTQRFTVKALENSPEITNDRRTLQTFLLKAAGLQRAVRGAVKALEELENRSKHLQAALPRTNAADDTDRARLKALHLQLAELKTALLGDRTLTSRNESAPMSIAARSNAIYRPAVMTQSPVGDMLRDSYAIAAREFTAAVEQMRAIDAGLGALENTLDGKGAPWTPHRIPLWDGD